MVDPDNALSRSGATGATAWCGGQPGSMIWAFEARGVAIVAASATTAKSGTVLRTKAIGYLLEHPGSSGEPGNAQGEKPAKTTGHRGLRANTHVRQRLGLHRRSSRLTA